MGGFGGKFGTYISKIFVEEKELFFGNVKKGKELATDVYFKEGDKVIAEFSGKGTLKGDKLSGSYSVEYEGKEFVKVNVADFDLGALEDDCELYGKFNVSVGSGLMEVISEDEEKDLELTFPKDYHSEELKGKKVVFTDVEKDVKIMLKQLSEENK